MAAVRAFIEPGQNGLVESLFDVDRLVSAALEVLAGPAEFRPMGQAAQQLVQQKYSLDVAVPELKNYFERVATHGTTQVT